MSDTTPAAEGRLTPQSLIYFCVCERNMAVYIFIAIDHFKCVLALTHVSEAVAGTHRLEMEGRNSKHEYEYENRMCGPSGLNKR